MTLKPGEKINGGSYEIVSEIGRGGMGVVYEALHRPGGDRRAVKVFEPTSEFLQKFSKLENWDVNQCRCYLHKKFVEEAERLYKISCDCKEVCFARVYDLGPGDVDGLTWYAMEFIADRGGNPKSLEDVIEKSECKPSPEQIEQWFADLCEELDTLHARGFIHRDIKPANILLNADGHAVLVDFGVSIEADKQRKSFGQTSLPMPVTFGTSDYAAPEQKDGVITIKSDNYALGSVFWYIWTDHPAPLSLSSYDDFEDTAWDLDEDRQNKWKKIFGQLLAVPINRCEKLQPLVDELRKPAVDHGSCDADQQRQTEDRGQSGEALETQAAAKHRDAVGGRFPFRSVIWLGIGCALCVIAGIVFLSQNTNRWRVFFPQLVESKHSDEAEMHQREVKGSIGSDRRNEQDLNISPTNIVKAPLAVTQPVVFSNRNWNALRENARGQNSTSLSVARRRSSVAKSNSIRADANDSDLMSLARRWLLENHIALGTNILGRGGTNVVVLSHVSLTRQDSGDSRVASAEWNQVLKKAICDCARQAMPVGGAGCEVLKRFSRTVDSDETSDGTHGWLEFLLIMRFYSGRLTCPRSVISDAEDWIASCDKCSLLGPHLLMNRRGDCWGVGGVVGDSDGDDDAQKRLSRQMARIALGASIPHAWKDGGDESQNDDAVIIGNGITYGCLAAFPKTNTDPESVAVFAIPRSRDAGAEFDANTAAGRVRLIAPTINPKGYESATERVRKHLERERMREGFNRTDGSILHVESETFNCEDPRTDDRLFLQIDDAVLNAYQRSCVAIISAMKRHLTVRMYAQAGFSQKVRDEIRNADDTLHGWERLHEFLKIVALNGMRMIHEEQSWDAEKKRYEVAVAFRWDPDSEKEIKELSQTRLTSRRSGKYPVMDWLDERFNEGLVNSTGPLRYVDNNGDYWFIGVGVRELNLEEEAFLPNGCKINSQNAAQMMARVSLYGGVTLFEKGKEIEVDRSSANERTDAVVADSLKFALRHSREKMAHRGMRIIYQGKLRHPTSGKETIVTVVGIRSAEVDFSNWLTNENRENRLLVAEEPSEEMMRKMQQRDRRFNQMERNFDERNRSLR